MYNRFDIPPQLRANRYIPNGNTSHFVLVFVDLVSLLLLGGQESATKKWKLCLNSTKSIATVITFWPLQESVSTLY